MWVVYQNGRIIYRFNNNTITMRIAIDFFKIYKRLNGRNKFFLSEMF